MEIIYSNNTNRYNLLIPREELVEVFRLPISCKILYEEISNNTEYFDLRNSEYKYSFDRFSKVIQTNDNTIFDRYSKYNSVERLREYRQSSLNVFSNSFHTFVKINNNKVFNEIVTNKYHVKYQEVYGIGFYSVLLETQEQTDYLISLFNIKDNFFIQYGRPRIDTVLPIIYKINEAIGISPESIILEYYAENIIRILPTQYNPILECKITNINMDIVSPVIKDIGRGTIRKYGDVLSVKITHNVPYVLLLLSIMNANVGDMKLYLSSSRDNDLLVSGNN